METSPDLFSELGYVSREAFCRLVKWSPQHEANERSAGRAPRFVKRGRVILYTREAIAEWLESGARS